MDFKAGWKARSSVNHDCDRAISVIKLLNDLRKLEFELNGTVFVLQGWLRS